MPHRASSDCSMQDRIVPATITGQQWHCAFLLNTIIQPFDTRLAILCKPEFILRILYTNFQVCQSEPIVLLCLEARAISAMVMHVKRCKVIYSSWNYSVVPILRSTQRTASNTASGRFHSNCPLPEFLEIRQFNAFHWKPAPSSSALRRRFAVAFLFHSMLHANAQCTALRYSTLRLLALLHADKPEHSHSTVCKQHAQRENDLYELYR